MLRVGKDVQPGTYTTKSGISHCYWARLKGFSGSLDDIEANDNVVGVAIVTIGSSDTGFQSQGCGSWYSLSQVPPRADPAQMFGQGTFVVKAQVAAGTWQSDGTGHCYWERLSAFGGTLDDILANDNAAGSTIVTISPGDVGFRSQGCGIWTKVG